MPDETIKKVPGSFIQEFGNPYTGDFIGMMSKSYNINMCQSF